MRYRLPHPLLIVLAVVPPIMALLWLSPPYAAWAIVLFSIVLAFSAKWAERIKREISEYGNDDLRKQ